MLGNDDDPDGDPLTAVLAENVSSGVLALNANGGFVYTPTLNYNGAVTFTYRASDTYVLSNLAVVTITVYPINHWSIYLPIVMKSFTGSSIP